MADILESIDDFDDDEFETDEFDDEAEEVLTGELVEADGFDLEDYEMNERQAKEITEAIRSTAIAVFVLISEAHKHKAHKALGYSTWAEYVKEEFDMTASRSYQLLDFGKAVEMIETAVPEGTNVKLTEAQARDIKRELPKITEQLQEETAGMSPEDAAARAEELIEEQREELKQQKEEEKADKTKEKALEDAEEEGYRAGLEAAADAMLEADNANGMTDVADDGFIEVDIDGDEDAEAISPEVSMHLYNFFNMLSSVTSFPAPEEFVKFIPESRAEEVDNYLLEAASWINRIQTIWELRNKD